MTAEGKAFALSADIPEAWCTEQAKIENDAYSASNANEQPRQSANHLGERDKADMLNVDVQGVREMFEHKLLAGANHDGRVVYSKWQITQGGHLLPHLTAVLRAADDIDAQTLQAVMECVDEDLDGLSPTRWPAEGGPVESIQQTLAEWWWT